MKDQFKKLYHDYILNSFSVYADLGTSQTRIALKDRGVILKEPTYLAYHQQLKEYLFFGREAKEILGKTPEFLRIIRPMTNGIISEFDAQVALMKTFFHFAVTPYMRKLSFIRPSINIYCAYPVIATEIEQKAVEEVLLKSGASRVSLIQKPIATASGCDVDVFSHKPVLIVDLGGGLIEISIISGGGIVASRSIKNAGEHMNKLIANYLYLKHGIILGEATCEKLKIECFHFEKDDESMLIRGKSLENGLPKSLKVKRSEIYEALIPSFLHIIEVIKELIELSQPEVVDEIYETGIFLTGGLSRIKGIAPFFQKELEIPIQIPPHADSATIYGLLQIDKQPLQWNKLITSQPWI